MMLRADRLFIGLLLLAKIGCYQFAILCVFFININMFGILLSGINAKIILV